MSCDGIPDLNFKDISDVQSSWQCRGEGHDIFRARQLIGVSEARQGPGGDEGIQALQLQGASKVLGVHISQVACRGIVDEIYNPSDNLTDGLGSAIRIRSDGVAQGGGINGDAKDISSLEISNEAEFNIPRGRSGAYVGDGDV